MIFLKKRIKNRKADNAKFRRTATKVKKANIFSPRGGHRM